MKSNWDHRHHLVSRFAHPHHLVGFLVLKLSTVVPLDEAMASIAAMVIVSVSEERTDRNEETILEPVN